MKHIKRLDKDIGSHWHTCTFGELDGRGREDDKYRS